MKLAEWIGKRSPETLAALELEDAKRSLLEAQSGAEYALAMVTYHQTRIKRLQEAINKGELACQQTIDANEQKRLGKLAVFIND